MPTIPPAMLKQLYQRGSLRNTASGWQFALRNHLAPATLLGLNLACDGVEIAPGAVAVSGAGPPVTAAALTAAAPFRFATGIETVVQVTGSDLAPGPHALSLQAHTREIGRVTINVQDTIAG